MTAKGKLYFVVFVAIVILLISLLVNSQLNKATDTISEEIKARGAPINRGGLSPAAMAEEKAQVSAQAIAVIGAVPVEQKRRPAVERKRDAGIQPQNPASAAAGKDNPALGAAAPAGISVIQEPSREEKKRMDDKGIIIF